MSGTETQHDLPDGGGDDILAAEYALGVLPTAERADIAARAQSDAAFARLVAEWEERLSPMDADFKEEPLPPAIKRALDLRLFGQARQPRSGLWFSLTLWRSIAAITTAAFLMAVALPALQPQTPAERLAASLTAEGSEVTYLAIYDATTGNVSLAHLTGDPVDGQDFELWVARGNDAPVSLGVIPVGAATHVTVTEATRDLMTSEAHMAISLEPLGGSPTGQPTGPVLAVGDLIDI